MSEMADRPLCVPEENILLHCLRTARWFSNLRLVPRLREHAARPLMRLYRLCFYDGLTRVSKVLLICSALIFLFSYRINSDLLLTTAAVSMTLLAWSLALGYLYRPRVNLGRQTPEVAVAGQPLHSRMLISNTGPRSLYNFTVREMVVPDVQWPREWQRPHVARLPSGQQAAVPISFLPRKRGLLTLSGIAVQSYFPYFLTRFTQRIPSEHKLYVLPPTLQLLLPSLRKLADQASKRLTFGNENLRQGPALEYAYSRQYQTGDSLRRLDHRASSRYGEPMSKVFEGAEEIRRDQVYLMLDLTLEDFQRWQRRPTSIQALDERLALAVELGLSAQNEGFNLVGLATGNTWHSIDSINQFYRHIATCQPQRAVTHSNSALPDGVSDENGLHILVTGRWSPEAQAKVERWQRQGILVLVFLIAENDHHRDSLPVGQQFIEVQLGVETGGEAKP